MKAILLFFISFGVMAMTSSNIEKATLAGGCFWGMEDLIKKIPGVTKTQVGYTGGNLKDPKYTFVKTGTTGHAEAVEIEFDNTKTNFENILINFFKMHDPTTVNQQGNDRGSQYRSAIFYHGLKQKEQAILMKERVEKSNAWKKPVVTEIVEATTFYAAEDYHQDYIDKNPSGYTCHWVRELTF